MMRGQGVRAWGVVVAAGRGDRFGEEKQHSLLHGSPLWEWARRALVEGGMLEVVVVGAGDGPPGGERRRDSVMIGLELVPTNIEFVLVHDAARPLASADLARSVLGRLGSRGVDGVVPALPVRDALKRVNGDVVVASVARQELVSVQTPQGFLRSSLLHAHQTVDGDAADDAELVQAAGGKIVTVTGEPANIKVTYPEDLVLVERLHAG